MLRSTPCLFLLVLLFVAGNQYGWSQTSQQKNLEQRKQRLEQEIRDINRLLFAQREQKGSVLDQMEALDQKINRQQELIRVTNQQTNLLNRQINANIRNITKLRKDLDDLKADYAQMIRKSYQNKGGQSRFLFLFSSEDFYQMFKRLQYMRQYTRFRREQGEQIQLKTTQLAEINKELTLQRKDKQQVLASNKKVKAALMKEVGSQKELLQSIRKNESNYAAAIDAKKKEAREIERQIERLIRSAIVASNRESRGSGASRSADKFALTPEATLLASSFSANKGKLIWPVEKGIKKQGFGVYKDAVYPGIKHQSNGVIIATDQGAKARSVFEGEVIAILAVPGGNKGVQIKHGNYISTYYNLSNLYVKKGDKVSAKEELGEIHTNRSNGLTQLKFYLYRDATRLNPEDWIYKL